MNAKFYVIGSPNYISTFVLVDDDTSYAREFATEAAAIEEAKLYAPCIVVKTVAEVTETSRVKVTKVK